MHTSEEFDSLRTCSYICTDVYFVEFVVDYDFEYCVNDGVSLSPRRVRLNFMFPA